MRESVKNKQMHQSASVKQQQQSDQYSAGAMQEVSKSSVTNLRQSLTFINNGQNTRNRIIACSLWLIGCSCWVLTFLYPNQHNIRPQVTVIWRSTMQLLISFILLHFKGRPDINIVDDNQFFYCTLRAIIISLNIFIFAFCQFYLPLPIVHTLNCTLPIFTALLDYLINNNKFTRIQTIGMVSAFIGVIFIITNSKQVDKQRTQFGNYREVSKYYFVMLQILLLANSGMVSYAFIITKKLTSVSPLLMTFHHGVVFMIFSGAIYYVDFTVILGEANNIGTQIQTIKKEIQILTTSVFIKGFFLSGLVVSVGNLLQLFALKLYPESGKVVIMQYFTVVLAYIISIVYYSEPLDFVCFIGVLVTILGIFATLK